MKPADLFPTPIWYIEGTPLELIDELYKGAYRCKEKYESVTISNRGGYQSPNFKFEEFHPQGIELINKTVDNAIERNFEIIGWWYNINGKGDYNTPHTHPGSDLALVLYLTETDGLLYFVNPFSHRKMELDNTAFSPHTKKGDILIFPADLLHFVKPNQREEDRVSISMNLQLC
jgi:uncharacterized protein (TIGR02466 family)